MTMDIRDGIVRGVSTSDLMGRKKIRGRYFTGKKDSEVGMTDNEKAVMTDCYKFLNEFNQPPPGDAVEWWEQAAEELSVLGVKHKNHPLALTVGPAVYEYLEQKWKAINRRYGK